MARNRRIATATMVAACSLILAACGEQIATHVEAGETVHSALTSVFNSATTQLVITGQNLPGQASTLDGSFSVVITSSQEAAQSTAIWSGRRSVDLSVYHQSTNLLDLREVQGSFYLRVDLKDLLAFESPGSFPEVSSLLNGLAARQGLGFLHDILVGNWVAISAKNLLTFDHQMQTELPKAQSSGLNLQDVNHVSTAVTMSFLQSLRVWLSIHKKAASEYSLSLPVRHFVGSLLGGVAKPLATYEHEPLLSRLNIAKAVASIPANLSVHADMWVRNGAMSRLQIFIPGSKASLLIGISHPASPVQAPVNATMLTASSLTDLFSTAIEATATSGGF